MVKKLGKNVFQFKVTLKGTKPVIWRRFWVMEDITFIKLHDVLQIVMGWQDSHLHVFSFGRIQIGDITDDEFAEIVNYDERSLRLNEIFTQEKQSAEYEYDFGDSWRHKLTLEKILPWEAGITTPICLTGKSACPLEDVGGTYGYEEFLKVINDPEHEDHEWFMSWGGGDFDPGKFDLDAVNEKLADMGEGRSTEAMGNWYFHFDEEPDFDFHFAPVWLPDSPPEVFEDAENAPLRKDITMMLAHLQDHKVVGTQSKGNFTVKAVMEMNEKLCHPIDFSKLLFAKGKANSEEDHHFLMFRHTLAWIGYLIQGGQGKRWKLTPLGEKFLQCDSAVVQTWFLFLTWWANLDWFVRHDGSLHESSDWLQFTRLLLHHLYPLLFAGRIKVDQFVQNLWTDFKKYFNEDQPFMLNKFEYTVIRTMITPLSELGLIKVNYKPNKYNIEVPEAFSITELGKRFFGSIRAPLPDKDDLDDDIQED